MTTTAAAVPTDRWSWRFVAYLSGLLVLGVAPYLAGVLIPYYVNDLDSLPLAEVAGGGHDPKDLWPYGGLGGLAQLAGFLSFAATPVTLVGVLVLASFGAVAEWRAARRPGAPVAIASAGVALLSLALLSWFTTPTASALLTWRLD